MKKLSLIAFLLLAACMQPKQPTADMIEQEAINDLQQGKLEIAAEKLNKILTTSPERWKSFNAKGILHSFRNELPQAESAFAAANAISSNNVVILNNWGLALAMDQRYDEAIAKLMQAVEAAPQQSRSQPEMNLAMIYALSGNEKPAEMILRRYMAPEDIEGNMKFYRSVRRDREQSRRALQKSYGLPNGEDSANEPFTILPPPVR